MKLWRDKGPLGLDVSQGRLGAMPSYTQNAVVFNGTDYLTRGSYSGLPVGAADRTAFYVVRNSGGSGFRKAVFYGGINTGQGFGLSTMPDGGPYLSVINEGVMTQSTWPVGGVVATGEAANTQLTFYLDGVDAGSQAVPTMLTTSTGALTLGALSDGTELWVGAVAEHILYNRALTAEERAEVENYLANRWGVPVTHP